MIMHGVVFLVLVRGFLAQSATMALRTRTVTITTTRSTTVCSPTSSPGPVPTMLAKQDNFTFQGCFKQPIPDNTGEMFGYDYIIPANASDLDKLTAGLCVKLCGAAKTTSGGAYGFAALLNGRDCYCSTQISSDTMKELDERCALPCPGDSTQSCGGNGYLAIYSLGAILSTHSAETSTRQANPSSSEAPSTFYAAENAQDDQPSKAPTGATVAVIAGSVLGFVALCALILIGLKLHRRNKQLKSSGHRRVGSLAGVLKVGAASKEKEKCKSVGFKKGHSIITNGPFSKAKTPTREHNGTWPFGRWKNTDEVVATGHGATTGAEWRPDNNPVRGSGLSPRTPSAVRDEAAMTFPAHPKPETVAQVPTLGDRAWHRRRHSVSFPPNAAKGAVGQNRLAPGQDGQSNQPQQTDPFVRDGNVPTLPVLNFDPQADTGPAKGAKKGPEPSPPFTLWTLPSTPSLPQFDGMKEGSQKKSDEK